MSSLYGRLNPISVYLANSIVHIWTFRYDHGMSKTTYTDNLIGSDGMSALSERLNYLIDKAKVSINKLHKLTGVPLTTIKRMRSDDNANPTLSSLLPLAHYFNVSINQLVGIEPLLDAEQSHLIKQHPVPLLSWETVAVNNEQTTERSSNTFIYTDSAVSNNAFALTVVDNDWEGFLKDSILIIDPDTPPHHRDFVLIHKTNTSVASLNEFIIDDGINYLKPANRQLKIKQMDSSYRVIGVVVQIRMDRRIS